MFKDVEEQKEYIKEVYPEVTAFRKNQNQWDLQCSECQIVRGFEVIIKTQSRSSGIYSSYNSEAATPVTIIFRCPVCDRHQVWILFQITEVAIDEDGAGTGEEVERYFKVTSLPGDGFEDIPELPDRPVGLREAYRQATLAMNAGAYPAAAAMFRKALQIITREVLGAKAGTLASELKQLRGKEFNGGKLTGRFEENAFIVKEAGNQAAHPDKDIDLLDFTETDAQDLRAIFLEIVGDLFVVPAITKSTKERFLQSRKINMGKQNR